MGRGTLQLVACRISAAAPRFKAVKYMFYDARDGTTEVVRSAEYNA